MPPFRAAGTGARGTLVSWAVRLAVLSTIPLAAVAVLSVQQRGPGPEADAVASAEEPEDPEAQREAGPPVRERDERAAVSRSGVREPAGTAVTLVVRGAATQVETDADTVGGLLDAEQVSLGPDDRVRPGVDAALRGGMRVEVDAVDVETDVESEKLPFETVRRETSSRERGTEVVAQEGADGVREITTERVVVNGFVESVGVVDEQVTEPTNRVVEVGTAPPPEPEPERSSSGSSSGGGSGGDNAVWDRLAECESNGNWQANTGNGFYGGLQFMKGTWDSVGGTEFAEYPHQASREQQITAGKRLQQSAGWGQWPHCSRALGLR